MKTETRQKLIECIDKLQAQIKGGPGSGPRPGGGGGHSIAAHNAANAAAKFTGARNHVLKHHIAAAVGKSKEAAEHAKAGRTQAARDVHTAAAGFHDRAARLIESRQGYHKNDATRADAARMHREAAAAHMHAAANI